MNPYSVYLNNLVNKNKSNFAEYPNIKWLNPYQALEAHEKRDKLMSSLSEKLLFKETKTISPSDFRRV
jgi:hypothetical protein